MIENDSCDDETSDEQDDDSEEDEDGEWFLPDIHVLETAMYYEISCAIFKAEGFG